MKELQPLFKRVDDWFTDLSLSEPISQFNLVDKPTGSKKGNTSNNTKNDTKDTKSLDSLAKDLELLLGYDEDLSYHNFFDDDEINLLDESIGSCCTLSSKPSDVKREISVTFPKNSDHQEAWVKRNHQNKDLLITTSMPPDHDYISGPTQVKVLSKEFIRSIKHERCSVLNIGAIKRFAKFSNQLEALGNRHAREIKISSFV